MAKMPQIRIKKSQQAKPKPPADLDLRTPNGKKLPY